MKYLVLDEETTIFESHKRKANPFDARNWIVARGWKKQGDKQNSWTYHPKYDRSTYMQIDPDVGLIVAHNAKFELLWELCQGNTDLHEFFKRGGKIWCTQYAEYLLQGQHPDYHMCSLDSIVESYGGTKKIDEVKALWDAGVQTYDIPEDLLIDYLVGTEAEGRAGGDIGNTEKIFLGQIKKAREQGQLKMIEDRMDGLCATAHMEFYGLKVDIKAAAEDLKELKIQLVEAEEELNSYIPDDVPFEFTWTRFQSSALIFGGSIKYQAKANYIDQKTGELARFRTKETHYVLDDGSTIPVSEVEPENLYQTFGGRKIVLNLSGKKKGEPKTKQVDGWGELKERYGDFHYTFPGYTEPDEDWAGAQTDALGAPIYSTSGDVLDVLATRNVPFLKAFTRKTALDKEIGTYYVRNDPKKGRVGMLTCVQPHDNMLHHKLNHTSTVTTRLSSSDPNMQNLPRGDKSKVKRMFISRFDGGVMIEADYSQLEVVVQGVLTGDENLCKFLNEGTDFHCLRLAKKPVALERGLKYEDLVKLCKDEAGPEYAFWKKERTKCKEFSFQLAYGSGAANIANTTGMDIEEVKQMMQAEEELFPGVKALFASVESASLKSAVAFREMMPSGGWKTYRRGFWTAPTGTRYSFRTYDAPAYAQKRGVQDTFMPTEMKNYPIQGAGGEFVQGVACGKLWREFVARDYFDWQAYPVNTVHDCVWVDSHPAVVDEAAALIKRVMESIPDFYRTRHGMVIDVPFPAEVETGPNMLKLHHWHAKEAA